MCHVAIERKNEMIEIPDEKREYITDGHECQKDKSADRPQPFT